MVRTTEDPQDLGFDFVETKQGDVRMSRHRQAVKQLRKREAIRFLERVAGLAFAEQQIHMARVTGQYKFGNERLAPDKRKAKQKHFDK